MHGQDLARFLDGIVGNCVSALLFCSPLLTFYKIWKKKSTEEFHPFPYLAALMNCMMWVFYGLPFVHPDSVLVVTINGFGLIMEILYLAFFFFYTKPKWRKTIIFVVLGELIALGAIAAGTLLGFHTTTQRSNFVGAICVFFGLIMYGSPLSNMYEVYKAKNSEFMPIPLILVSFVNGCIWLAYGLLKKFDRNIVIGNGVGALLALVQIFVYVCFRKGKKNVGVGKKPAVELVGEKKPAEELVGEKKPAEELV